MDQSQSMASATGTGRLTLLQTFVHWLAPKSIYIRPPAVARRTRGFRLISVTHELVPTPLGRRLRFPYIRGGYEGAARRWNSIETGEPITNERFIDWLERIWLAAIGVEPAPDLFLDRPVDRVT
ncbi:hypothetical protein [Beijerinckia sp. L45]|uniref:hypothetical protein n=1 Tax=Beijerinckia sp. L45 TaxID=1641855 RepID=UPI00131AE930|nr:hypothetical protein [Beijerinckia sp. L45]